MAGTATQRLAALDNRRDAPALLHFRIARTAVETGGLYEGGGLTSRVRLSVGAVRDSSLPLGGMCSNRNDTMSSLRLADAGGSDSRGLVCSEDGRVSICASFHCGTLDNTGAKEVVGRDDI
jgi:hypothetical protein